MARALAGRANSTFNVPEGNRSCDIDRDTGKIAAPGCPRVFKEAFLSGTEPNRNMPAARFGEYTVGRVTRTISCLIAALACAGTLSCRKPAATQSDTQSSAPAPAPATAGEPTPTPAAPPKPMPAQLPDVLARVNGEPVNKADFDRLILNIEVSNGPIPPERRDAILRNMLDQLITYTVMSQQAKTESIVASEAEIEGRIKQMQSGASDAEFTKALEARKMSREQLRTDTRVQLTIEKLLEAQVAEATVTTDAEARAFYDKNPDKFKQDESPRQPHPPESGPKAPAASRKRARGQSPAAEAGAERRRLRAARHEALAGRERAARRGSRTSIAGADGPDVLGRGLRAETGRDQRRRDNRLRLSHHQGHGQKGGNHDSLRKGRAARSSSS